MTRRERVLKAIADHWAEHGYAPSLQDISDAAELGHRSMALYYLRALASEDPPRVTFSERRPRTVRLVEQIETTS